MSTYSKQSTGNHFVIKLHFLYKRYLLVTCRGDSIASSRGIAEPSGSARGRPVDSWSSCTIFWGPLPLCLCNGREREKRSVKKKKWSNLSLAWAGVLGEVGQNDPIFRETNHYFWLKPASLITLQIEELPLLTLSVFRNNSMHYSISGSKIYYRYFLFWLLSKTNGRNGGGAGPRMLSMRNRLVKLVMFLPFLSLTFTYERELIQNSRRL